MSTIPTTNQIRDYIQRPDALSMVKEGPHGSCSTRCANINFTMTIEIRLNGETQALPASLTVVQLLEYFGLPKDRVAVERNRAIVPKANWSSVSVASGDELEVVQFVGGGARDVDPFVIAGHTFRSRLIVG